MPKCRNPLLPNNEMSEPTRTYDAVTCPYCGFVDPDTCMLDLDEPVECANCDRPFRCVQETIVTYVATPLTVCLTCGGEGEVPTFVLGISLRCRNCKGEGKVPATPEMP